MLTGLTVPTARAEPRRAARICAQLRVVRILLYFYRVPRAGVSASVKLNRPNHTFNVKKTDYLRCCFSWEEEESFLWSPGLSQE